MTTPKQMKLRRVDNDALHTEIARQRANIEGMQIHTRSQTRLADAERDRSDLEAKQVDVQGEIAKTEKNIAALQELLVAQKAVDADIAIDLNAVQETIHALRQSGVTLP